METIIEPDAMIGRRLYRRAQIAARVECCVGGCSKDAVARDVSLKGCLLQCPAGFAEQGDEIEISSSIQGQVMWREGLYVGVQFSSLIPDSLIAALTSKAARHEHWQRARRPAAGTRRSHIGRPDARRSLAFPFQSVMDDYLERPPFTRLPNPRLALGTLNAD
jgi:hypothetical protein